MRAFGASFVGLLAGAVLLAQGPALSCAGLAQLLGGTDTACCCGASKTPSPSTWETPGCCESGLVCAASVRPSAVVVVESQPDLAAAPGRLRLWALPKPERLPPIDPLRPPIFPPATRTIVLLI